ncbi:MAG: hypothetical protein HY914_06835, partial [Desulfomonile tiedjei]|nr:hypothetical protein [Desulfomonile tiedjei]
MAQYDLNLRDYWLVVRKRKGIILLTMLLVSGVTWVMTLLASPQMVYEASARVKFDRSTSMSGLMTEVLAMSSEGSNIATQAEIIRSVPVLVRAGKKLGLVNKEVEPKEARFPQAVLAKVYDLKNNISVSQEGTMNILKIAATAEAAELAARLANAVAEAYREENIASRNRQVDEAKLFVEGRLKDIEESYRKSEQALVAFKEREGNVFLNDEARQALEIFNRLESERERLAQVKREVVNQLQLLKTNLTQPASAPARIFSDDVQALIAKLNQKLVDLTTERSALLINYTAKHPQVAELDARIRSVKQEMIQELEAKSRTFSERESAIGDS